MSRWALDRHEAMYLDERMTWGLHLFDTIKLEKNSEKDFEVLTEKGDVFKFCKTPTDINMFQGTLGSIEYKTNSISR